MELSGLKYLASGGESIDSIALDVYGDEKYAAEILCVNPKLSGVMVFQGNEEILLPVVDVPEESADNVYMPDDAPWK